MQDCELYGRILDIAAPWRVERVELQLTQGEVHVIWPMKTNWSGPVPNAEPVVPSTIIKPRGSGGIWIPVSTAPFCMPHRRAVSLHSVKQNLDAKRELGC
jgi:hypothetical protein